MHLRLKSREWRWNPMIEFLFLELSQPPEGKRWHDEQSAAELCWRFWSEVPVAACDYDHN